MNHTSRLVPSLSKVRSRLACAQVLSRSFLTDNAAREGSHNNRIGQGRRDPVLDRTRTSSTSSVSTNRPRRGRRLQLPSTTFTHIVPTSSMETRSLSTSAASEEPALQSAPYVGPLEQTIRDKLNDAFRPVVHLDVLNESHMHNVPKNSETHFKVIVVSAVFDGVPVIQRHRKVNSVLADELQRAGGIHALSIVAKTPAQWDDMVQSGKAVVEPSPKCRGGDGSLPSRTK